MLYLYVEGGKLVLEKNKESFVMFSDACGYILICGN